MQRMPVVVFFVAASVVLLLSAVALVIGAAEIKVRDPSEQSQQQQQPSAVRLLSAATEGRAAEVRARAKRGLFCGMQCSSGAGYCAGASGYTGSWCCDDGSSFHCTG